MHSQMLHGMLQHDTTLEDDPYTVGASMDITFKINTILMSIKQSICFRHRMNIVKDWPQAISDITVKWLKIQGYIQHVKEPKQIKFCWIVLKLWLNLLLIHLLHSFCKQRSSKAVRSKIKDLKTCLYSWF